MNKTPPQPNLRQSGKRQARKGGSIRNSIMALTLLPATAVSALWLSSMLTVQRTDLEEMIQQNVSSIANNLARSLRDTDQNKLADMSRDANQNTISLRLGNMLSSTNVPLHDAVVTDQEGDVLAAYSSPMLEDETQSLNLIARWKKLSGSEAEKQLKAQAVLTGAEIKQGRNETSGTMNFGGKKYYSATAQIPESSQLLTVTISDEYIAERSWEAVKRSLIPLITGLLAAVLAGSLFANGLIGRIQRLTREVSRASRGEAGVIIPIEGQDELTELAKDAEKLYDSYTRLEEMTL